MGLLFAVSLLMALRNRMPKRDRAAVLYAKFVKKCGIEPKTGETPALFASRVAAGSSLAPKTVATITRTYLDARYGSPDPDSLHRLEVAVSRL